MLVEKPLALNAAQAEQLAELATAQGVFCMEALWTMFLPKFDVIRQLLADGALGEIRTVQADHGEYFAPGHRILRADLAGGPHARPRHLPGLVRDVGARAHRRACSPPGSRTRPGSTGRSSMILNDARANQAVLHTTVFSNTPTTGAIAGTAGTLTIPGPFYQPGPMTLTGVGGAGQGASLTWDEPRIAHEALYFEAAEVARCVSAGMLESPLRPLAGLDRHAGRHRRGAAADRPGLRRGAALIAVSGRAPAGAGPDPSPDRRSSAPPAGRRAPPDQPGSRTRPAAVTRFARLARVSG